MEELTRALKSLKRNKACDDLSVGGELLKDGCMELWEAVLRTLNDIISFKVPTPEAWKRIRTIVLFKKGDPTLPQNYRPIALLRITYKLFSRMLCARLSSYLLLQQSPEQAAYKPGFSTEDHLVTLTLLYEGAREWNLDLWLVLVDFEKAFDTVERPALWTTLYELGLPSEYICLLQALYTDEVAQVFTDVGSREFSILRGVKQGDPVSALLFITVLEQIMRILKKEWLRLSSRRKGLGYGIVIDSESDPLTNVRFADDLLLVARCRADAKKMLCALQRVAATYGLKVHMGKTKMLALRGCADEFVQVGHDRVAILNENESGRYLGRKLSLGDFHGTELRNRIAAGCASFSKYKAQLCNKRLSAHLRLRLFQTVVTLVILYGCGAWTLTRSLERSLITAQRRMLRMMFAKCGNVSQDVWTEWIIRETARVEAFSESQGVKSWCQAAKDKKSLFATKTALQGNQRWNQRLLHWQPQGARKVGRPWKRWIDDLA